MAEYSIFRARTALITWLVIVVVVVLTTIPYWIAANAGTETHVFAGVMMNPVDGQTYLAKMRQGWEGSWRFSLPYTSDPGEGAYIFLYYLGLGHLSRISGMTLEITYQVARILGAGVMLLALSQAYLRLLPSRGSAMFAYVLAAFGTGLGWLLLPLDAFTSDFWVAEAYPFLSAYINPHFPLTIALMVILLTPSDRMRYYGVGTVLIAVPLALISPFGVLVSAAILGVFGGYRVYKTRVVEWPVYRLGWLILGGGLVLGYTFLAVQRDPILAGWNSQNQTPSPPVWDFLLSFSPALLMGLWGAWAVFKKKTSTGIIFLIWVLIVIGLIYMPINLQRRLLVGFYVAAAGLAAVGLSVIQGDKSRTKFIFGALVLLFSLPTSLLVLLAGLHGAQTLEPALYLTKGEAAALIWIEENTPPKALVLTGPETGLFLPGRTGRRVVYGHPFETVHAAEMEALVLSYFDGSMSDMDDQDFLADHRVEYILVGPRELAIGAFQVDASMDTVFSSDGVTVYKVIHEPDG